MKLNDILVREACIVDMKARTKKEALRELSEVLAGSAKSLNGAALLEMLLEREKLGTTAMGDGIAIHGTESPQLILNPDPEARRVSHGCIRLTNEHARELMHMVDVGTTVLIF